MNYIIYKATSPSGKVYIGLTKKTLDERKKEHIWFSKSENTNNRPFPSALKKYNYEFMWEIIETNLTLEQAEQKEIYYIEFYKSTDRQFGYNLSAGGLAGSIMSEEGKKRHKEKMSKHYSNPEYVKKITKHLKERKDDPNYYNNQKNYINNYFSKEENRKKHSEITKISNNKRESKIKRALSKGGKPFYCVETGEEFILLKDAGERIGTDKRNISNHLNRPNRYKSVKGYTFKYK